MTTKLNKDQVDGLGGMNTTEKVLNTQCKARAYLNGNQLNLTNNTFTKVLLNAESYDVGSDFDTANSRFVAPVSGYYQVSATVCFINLVANKRYLAAIYVNGGVTTQSISHASTPVDVVLIPVSDILYVTAGQYIELYALSLSGDNTVDLEGLPQSTMMAVHLLSV